MATAANQPPYALPPPSASANGATEQPVPDSHQLERMRWDESIPEVDVVILLDGSPQPPEWQKNVHLYFARILTDVVLANHNHRIRVGVVCYSRATSDTSIRRSPILGTIPLSPPDHVMTYLKTHRPEVGIGRAACSGGMAVLDAIVAALEMFDDQIEAHNIRKRLKAHESKFILPPSKPDDRTDPKEPPLPKFYILLFAHSPTNTTTISSRNVSRSLDGLAWDGLPNEMRKRRVHFNLVTMTHLPELKELHQKTVDKPGQAWFQLPVGHTMLTSGLPARPPFLPDGARHPVPTNQPNTTHGTPSSDNPHSPNKRAKLNSARPFSRAPPGHPNVAPHLNSPSNSQAPSSLNTAHLSATPQNAPSRPQDEYRAAIQRHHQQLIAPQANQATSSKDSGVAASANEGATNLETQSSVTAPATAQAPTRATAPQVARKPVVPNPMSVPNSNSTQLLSTSTPSKAAAEGGLQAQSQQQHLSRQATQVAQVASGTSPSRTPVPANGTSRAQPLTNQAKPGQISTPTTSRSTTTQPPISSAPQAPAAQTSVLQSQVPPSQPPSNSIAQMQQLQFLQQQQQQHQRSASSSSVPTVQNPALDPRRIVTHNSSIGQGATQNPIGQSRSSNPPVQVSSGSQSQAGAHPSESIGQRKRWMGVVHFQAYDNSKRELKELQTLAFARSLTRTLEEAGVDSWPQTLRFPRESFRPGSLEEMMAIIKARNAPLVGFYPARQTTVRVDLGNNEKIYMALYIIMHQKGLVCAMPIQFPGQGTNRGIILFPVPASNPTEAPKIYGAVFVTEEIPRWNSNPAPGSIPRPPQPPQIEATQKPQQPAPTTNPTPTPALAQQQQFQQLAALSRARTRQLSQSQQQHQQSQQPPSAVGAAVSNIQQGDPVGLGLPPPTSGVANALGFSPGPVHSAVAGFGRVPGGVGADINAQLQVFLRQQQQQQIPNQLQSQPQRSALGAYGARPPQQAQPEFFPLQVPPSVITQGNPLLTRHAGHVRQASNSNLPTPEAVQAWFAQGKPGGTGTAPGPGR